MIRKLTDKPIAVTMTLIAVIVLGIVAANLLPVSLMPDVAIPQVTVQVSSPGSSAREVDMTVLKPLRNQLMQVSHLKEIRTEANDDAGNIFMRFEHGADIDFLFIEVNEKIDRALGSLPKEMERPRVIKASATDIPAFYINLTLQDSSGSVEMRDELFPVSSRFMDLSSFAAQVITKRIEQIPEVAMVDVSGLAYPELLIVPDKARLRALGIDVARLDAAIQKSNLRLGNLTIRDGQYQYSIRFESTLTGKKGIEDVYLNLNGRLYQVRDLARVIEHPQRRTGMVRSDGRDAVSLAVIKQSDARMKMLRKEISKTLEAFRAEYPHVRFTVTRDQTQLLDYSIDNLRNNILVGGILACLVIFLFMRDFRSPVLISITVPLSLVVSLLGFYLLGLSINIISLSGLVLGIGMMVDNSIIVIDNISQYWDKGWKLREAVVKGTEEVFAPMLSSVLTTCSVFVPLIFLSGITGALFYDQAMAVTIALFSSLLVSVLVIPVYYRLFYAGRNRREPNRYLSRFRGWDYHRTYERGLKWFFRHQAVVWIVFLATVPGIWGIYTLIDKEKLPPLTHDDTILWVDWNGTISMKENGRRVALLLQTLDGLTVQRTSMIGVQQFLLSHTPDQGTSEASVYLKAERPENLSGIERRVAEFMKRHYPEARYGFEMSGNIFDLIFSDKEPELVARLKPTDGKAPDPDKLNRLLTGLDRRLGDVSLEQVLWQEHIRLTVRPDLLALYKVDYGTVFSALKNAMNQNTLFTVQEGAFSVPVLTGEGRETARNLLQQRIVNEDGAGGPLSLRGTEREDRALKSIVSGAEGDYYPLRLNPGSRNVRRTMETIREAVQADPDFDVEFSGTYFSDREMIRELVVVLAIALLLLYFILAAQFESVVQPLIILSEVVVDVFGAMLILWAFGSSINIMSLIGLVVMCGIIINDSILKVDTINKLRKEGYSLIRAIMTGGSRRLKPIIMTSLTTILALVPFLYGGDMGSDLQYPLSLALIGGMVVGTLVSIFFVPMAYYELYRRKARPVYGSSGKK